MRALGGGEELRQPAFDVYPLDNILVPCAAERGPKSHSHAINLDGSAGRTLES